MSSERKETAGGPLRKGISYVMGWGAPCWCYHDNGINATTNHAKIGDYISKLNGERYRCRAWNQWVAKKILPFWQFQHRKWQWTWSIAWNEVVDEFYEVTPSSNIKESCLFWLNMWWQVYCSKLYDHVQGNVWSNGSEQSGN